MSGEGWELGNHLSYSRLIEANDDERIEQYMDWLG